MAKRHANHAGDLESLFVRLEELVLANSGEDEFEEVFKLVIAKLWDERCDGLEFHRYGSSVDTHSAISKLLKQADAGWPGIVEESDFRLTSEHLEVCVDALSDHVISDNTLEVMDSFFEFLASKSSKSDKGQYFTPRHVIEMCVRLLKPRSDEMVLDPACGSGGFLIHSLKFAQPDDIRKYCQNNIWGFDIDSRPVRVAKALMILAGDGRSNIMRINSLLDPRSAQECSGPHSTLTIEDIVRSRVRKHKGFDVIVTNPPFAGEIREENVLQKYDLAAGSSRIERDILFIERCIELLRPGGRMAIVLPHNKLSNAKFDYLRNWIFRRARVLAVIALGRNTFRPHTHQKASVLVLQRFRKGSSEDHEQDIFFGISENDGKNAKGQLLKKANIEGTSWEVVEHDLSEIVEEFEKFESQKETRDV